MKSLAIRGRIVTENEAWNSGTVLVEGTTIRAISRERLDADEVVDAGEDYVAPGFVDLQVNGAFGVDVVSHPDRLGELSRSLVSTGTTSYLPTLITLPLARYPDLLPHISLGAGTGAQPLRLHLEGPFINPEKKGAHPADDIAPPDPAALERMLGANRVGMVTIAPEMPGAFDLIEVASAWGVTVSLGHSNATFEEAFAALDSGARSVTHLFNAMSPLHHRDPGLPGAALAHPGAVCGIIPDGKHVHPEVVSLVFDRLGPDRIYLVTDAIAGMASGEYSLAAQKVLVEDGTPRLEDGTIAGSALLMDEALRNIIYFTGCALPEAVKMAATTPAVLIGAGNRKGRLAPCLDADVVTLSPDLEVQTVWIAGEEKWRRDAWI